MTYIDDFNSIWEAAKENLKEQMPESAVNLWFGNLKVTSFENNTVIFSIDSELKYNIILRQNYTELIAEAFEKTMGFPVSIEIVFVGDNREKSIYGKKFREKEAEEAKKKEEQEKLAKEKEEEEKKTKEVSFSMPPCNFEYTFDNFIVGGSNKFAHAACYAVAQNPAKNYNPLFIYGPSGLGKTHLLYAITNEMKKNNPGIRIIYIKGDDFTNQMIESLSNHEMSKFHEKYRGCDVLLIDDIQFIAGKVATQEEFFHTFNTLYEEHKQIILTSDRPPREIKTLEDRLKTRFEWGLIADIQPPDLELRIAIIKKKAEQVNIKIEEDVLTFLAENLRSNIRQLEGAIKKLAALSFLKAAPINLETAQGCISELLGGAEPVSVTIDKIFAAVFKKYGIPKEDIVSQNRRKDIAFARHVASYLIKDITEMSLPNIGHVFNRHHSTVISSIETINRKLIMDKNFELEIRALKKEVTGVDESDD